MLIPANLLVSTENNEISSRAVTSLTCKGHKRRRHHLPHHHDSTDCSPPDSRLNSAVNTSKTSQQNELEAIQRWSAICRMWPWIYAHVACTHRHVVRENYFVYGKFVYVRKFYKMSIFFPTMTSIKNSFCAFLAGVKTYTHTKN